MILTSATLEKIKLLPSTKQQEVADFVEFLIGKYLVANNDVISLEERRTQIMGRYSGKIQMLDDFNETPEDFRDCL